MERSIHDILRSECARAKAVVADILDAEHHDDASLARVLVDSPLQPWVMAQAKSVIIMRSKKTACFTGVTSGSGIMIARLPTSSPTLIRWSAPLFIKLQLQSYGLLSYGRRTAATFAVSTTAAAQQALASPRGHAVSGLECTIVCGTAVQERADVISANMAGDLSTVGVSKLSGTMIDISFCSGALTVDAEKNALVYGDAEPSEILAGGAAVPPPPEFSQLYGDLSMIVHGVERTSGVGPSRMASSLERYSAGRDPDRRIVLDSGQVLKEDANSDKQL